jgi:hypothetical protein
MGANSTRRHQFFHITAVASGTNRHFGVRGEHQLFKLMATGFTLILEDRHDHTPSFILNTIIATIFKSSLFLTFTHKLLMPIRDIQQLSI